MPKVTSFFFENSVYPNAIGLPHILQQTSINTSHWEEDSSFLLQQNSANNLILYIVYEFP